MDIKYYYNNLYKFQDIILEIFFEIESNFYLTGGTCLHRFLINARYSDDLDFFNPYSDDFGQIIREFLSKLNQNSIQYIQEIRSKTFARINVKEKNIILKIDFVNDPVKHFGKIEILNNKIKIDNYKNILSNKLSAILDRDEPKDVFDIFIISKNFQIDWKEIFSQLEQKVVVDYDLLIYRLKTFPINWVKKLKFIDNKYLDLFYGKYHNLTATIEENLNLV